MFFMERRQGEEEASSSRDLLHGFGSREDDDHRRQQDGLCPASVGAEEDDSENIELSLGLSLGGSSSCPPSSKKPRLLLRSSSIASFSSGPGNSEDFKKLVASALPLMRASSLPSEAEERRRLREVQSLKRMEAKRKRLERKSSMSSAKSGKEEDLEEAREQFRRGTNGLTGWAGRAPLSVVESASTNFLPMSSQCSAVGGCGGGSQAGSSSSVPEIAGLDNSSSTVRRPMDDANANAAVNSVRREQSSSRSLPARTGSIRDLGDVMGDMPLVCSKVEGPNGRRIEGFLYKYRKGEEVRIVCVCHGSFLTPAEFVRHAGGGDVTNPLRHIVVNPPPSAFI